MRTSFPLVALMALVGSSASAMPMMPHASNALSDHLIKAKIVCLEDGRCYQRGRPPVARWVYGEKNFSGPYVGRGYYGAPNYRWRWYPF